jgi:hypothetical protein
MHSDFVVIPAQAGIPKNWIKSVNGIFYSLDSRLRGNDVITLSLSISNIAVAIR